MIAMLGLAWVRWAIVAAVSAGLVASFAYQERAKERAKIERATHERTSKANVAGRKSADPSSHGVRNPHYRAD